MLKLIHGDCYRKLEKTSFPMIDCFVLSPPYNIGVKYNSYKDTLTPDQYLAKINRLAKAMEAKLNEHGSVFINVASTNKYPTLAEAVARQFRQFFQQQNHIIWVKSLSVGDTTYGHFKPQPSPRYLNNCYEHIYHFTKTGAEPIARKSIGVPYMDKSNLKRRGHTEDLRCAGNVWFIPYKTTNSAADRNDHPAIYPEELVERCLKLCGKKNMVVCDPFLGSGTTGVAALKLGHSFVGIELDEKYLKGAKVRIKKARKSIKL